MMTMSRMASHVIQRRMERFVYSLAYAVHFSPVTNIKSPKIDGHFKYKHNSKDAGNYIVTKELGLIKLT